MFWFLCRLADDQQLGAQGVSQNHWT